MKSDYVSLSSKKKKNVIVPCNPGQAEKFYSLNHELRSPDTSLMCNKFCWKKTKKKEYKKRINQNIWKKNQRKKQYMKKSVVQKSWLKIKWAHLAFPEI